MAREASAHASAGRHWGVCLGPRYAIQIFFSQRVVFFIWLLPCSNSYPYIQSGPHVARSSTDHAGRSTL